MSLISYPSDLACAMDQAISRPRLRCYSRLKKNYARCYGIARRIRVKKDLLSAYYFSCQGYSSRGPFFLAAAQRCLTKKSLQSYGKEMAPVRGTSTLKTSFTRTFPYQVFLWASYQSCVKFSFGGSRLWLVILINLGFTVS